MLACINNEQYKKLLENGSSDNRGKDHIPVVKLFTPDGTAAWLLTEIDPDNQTHAFGLCDLGLGFPELGYMSLEELSITRGEAGLKVECDKYFEPIYPISIYAEAARQMERVTTDNNLLLQRTNANMNSSLKSRCPKFEP